MIDQVCSLALTYAHSDGRPVFSRKDILEAMTTVEAGVAIGQTYPKHESRSIAIHEAGHAVCGHLYMESGMSTRLSIRRRGHSGGHHQIAEIEDRFVHWRSEEVGGLIWTLGAYAAEHIFYGQNTTGVGGDLRLGDASTPRTWSASPAWRRRRSTSPTGSRTARSAKTEEKRVLERFEKIGYQIMHRSGGDDSAYDASLKDPAKRKQVAGLLGQAFVIAWNTIRVNQRSHRARGRPARRSPGALRRRRRRAAQRSTPAQARHRRPG